MYPRRQHGTRSVRQIRRKVGVGVPYALGCTSGLDGSDNMFTSMAPIQTHRLGRYRFHYG